jgi:type VI protein secretion system component Hcp
MNSFGVELYLRAGRRAAGYFLSVVLCLLTIGLLSSPASAQMRTFVSVPGIQGSSIDESHPAWIDALSLQQAWGGVKKSPCEIQIVKGLDIAGPKLWLAAVTAQVFPEIRIDVVKGTGAGGSGGEVTARVYEVRLSNAQITNLVTTGTQMFAETVSLKAASMTLTYYPQNPDGAPGAPVTATIPCS